MAHYEFHVYGFKSVLWHGLWRGTTLYSKRRPTAPSRSQCLSDKALFTRRHGGAELQMKPKDKHDSVQTWRTLSSLKTVISTWDWYVKRRAKAKWFTRHKNMFHIMSSLRIILGEFTGKVYSSSVLQIMFRMSCLHAASYHEYDCGNRSIQK